MPEKQGSRVDHPEACICPLLLLIARLLDAGIAQRQGVRVDGMITAAWAEYKKERPVMTDGRVKK